MKTKEPKTMLAYIPHGVDHIKKFFPISKEDEEGQELMKKVYEQISQGTDLDFILFYNARNLRRKMTSDVILAYDYFLKKLPKEKADRCRIFLHTAPIDENGTDLIALLRDVTPNVKAVFSNQQVDPGLLNAMYNVCDATINIASNEGFGLGTCESLAAGTPIIVNVTGGLQDQCGFMNDSGEYLDPERDFTFEWGSNHDGRFKNHGEWAFPIWPKSISLQGSPVTPYIFDDRCDWKEVGERIFEVYNLSRDERKRRGLLGREYVMGAGMFTSEKMGELFIQHINTVLEKWTPRERYNIIKV